MGIIAWKDMQVGQTVRFVRFIDEGDGVHDHWIFTPGNVYTVVNDMGDIGPPDDEGSVPSCNWGFEFELVTNL